MAEQDKSKKDTKNPHDRASVPGIKPHNGGGKPQGRLDPDIGIDNDGVRGFSSASEFDISNSFSNEEQKEGAYAETIGVSDPSWQSDGPLPSTSKLCRSRPRKRSFDDESEYSSSGRETDDSSSSNEHSHDSGRRYRETKTLQTSTNRQTGIVDQCSY